VSSDGSDLGIEGKRNDSYASLEKSRDNGLGPLRLVFDTAALRSQWSATFMSHQLEVQKQRENFQGLSAGERSCDLKVALL
jgi:hypothetical protein